MAALEKILQQVKEGTLSIEEASLSLRKAPLWRVGYAKLIRSGASGKGFRKSSTEPEKPPRRLKALPKSSKRKVTVLSSLPACPKKKPNRFKRPCPSITKRRDA